MMSDVNDFYARVTDVYKSYYSKLHIIMDWGPT